MVYITGKIGRYKLRKINISPLSKNDFGIRKLTPRECFLFQGFPKDFVLPNISDCHLYKQAGNCVCVPVVERIAENILHII